MIKGGKLETSGHKTIHFLSIRTADFVFHINQDSIGSVLL